MVYETSGISRRDVGRRRPHQHGPARGGQHSRAASSGSAAATTGCRPTVSRACRRRLLESRGDVHRVASRLHVRHEPRERRADRPRQVLVLSAACRNGSSIDKKVTEQLLALRPEEGSAPERLVLRRPPSGSTPTRRSWTARTVRSGSRASTTNTHLERPAPPDLSGRARTTSSRRTSTGSSRSATPRPRLERVDIATAARHQGSPIYYTGSGEVDRRRSAAACCSRRATRPTSRTGIRTIRPGGVNALNGPGFLAGPRRRRWLPCTRRRYDPMLRKLRGDPLLSRRRVAIRA